MAESTKTADGYLGNCYTRKMAADKAVAKTRLEPIHASMQDLKNGGWFTSPKHGQPGTIAGVKMSKTGKHGHAKFTFNVSYPLTGQNSQEMHPGHTHLVRPVVKKEEFIVVDYTPDDGIVSVLDKDNNPCDLNMHPQFIPPNGAKGVSGEQFSKLWTEASENIEAGLDLIVEVLIAPIKKGKNDAYFVAQITNASLKEAQ